LKINHNANNRWIFLAKQSQAGSNEQGIKARKTMKNKRKRETWIFRATEKSPVSDADGAFD
jgi:hypothetical protein